MNAPDALARLLAPAWREANFLQALGPAYGTDLPPRAVTDPHWVARSPALAASLGLADWLAGDDALPVLAGNHVPAGARPFASVYSGHQFGVWAGQLGDGRALLLGEVDTPDGPMEVQLKGSGLTPYSRMGDGRAVLRSSVREFLASEAMHALDIPTTRALAVVGSPLPVRRETLESAAVVTRVAPSFLRFGHFEHFAHTTGDAAALQRLLAATVERYFPALQGAAEPAAALLEEVARRTARLMAQWQAVGFCHGVMNTDNMSLLGLTIDYGPYGFLDAFDPGHVCNHSDHQGRYAYARQPGVAFWNLHALAQALLPAMAGDDGAAREAAGERLLEALEPYKAEFTDALLAQWRAKLGLVAVRDEDAALADDLLRLMAEDRADFTITWRRLGRFGHDPEAVRDLFLQRDKFDAWAERYRQRLLHEPGDAAARAARMNRVNPKFVLRNHLAQAAIERAQQGDFGEVQRLLRVLERPFDEQPEHEADAGFPPAWASSIEVSCSS
ncbi:MAG TPA: YdiU family protein [Burkholderiaceae bacterium]|nr:YdiU family protein [Burkholderiaceae bacterium]